MQAPTDLSHDAATRPTILVVDDDDAIRRFLNAALSVNGYEVREATNGTEALRAASSYPVDLVLLDLGLPDADGLAVLAGLRQLRAAPVVVVSARDREGQKIAAL